MSYVFKFELLLIWNITSACLWTTNTHDSDQFTNTTHKYYIYNPTLSGPLENNQMLMVS